MHQAWWFLLVCIYAGSTGVCTVTHVDGPKECVDQRNAIIEYSQANSIHAKSGCIFTSLWV